MNRYFYDLHIHSCLSPCGDNDMTVNNIAGMAALKGLQIVALTDHNTCANCPAFFAACKVNGLVPVAGMEITTEEEIHLVTLFPELELAMRFEEAFRPFRMQLPNRPEIFGEQRILDENDEVIGEDAFLLPAATSLSLQAAAALVDRHGGICYPAHIDREANGILAILGTLPPSPVFGCVEFSPNADPSAYSEKMPELRSMRVITSSDAHYLWDIAEAEHFVTLCDEPYSSDLVRRQLFAYLKGAAQ